MINVYMKDNNNFPRTDKFMSLYLPFVDLLQDSVNEIYKNGMYISR